MKILLLLLALPLCAQMKVLKTISVGGEGGWDYLTVDSAGHRLFLSRGNRVDVLDLKTGKVVGEIPDTPGVHGIALNPSLGKGYISAGRANAVVVFNLSDLKTEGKIATGKNPDFILYDEPSGRVITMNGGSSDATLIDAKTGTVAATLPLGGKPEAAVSDGSGKVYINLEDKSELAEVDARAGKVLRHFKLEGCDEPSGLAIDVKHHRTFSGCGNKVMAVTALDSGKVIATIPIGAGVDANGFDQERGLAFSSNGGDGTLTVAKETSGGAYEVVQNVPTQRGARTMAVDPSTHHVFLVTAKFGTAEAGARRPPMLPGSFMVLEVGE
jgi:outer membrane protein assembly factor BamB